VSNLDQQEEIYMMNADGTNARRVTHRRGRDYTPVWLLGGTHLIFGSDQGGYNNILRLDLAVGTVHNLTNLTKSGAWSPSLSPDGTQLAYSTGLDPVSGAEHMMIMELDTGKVRELAQVGDGAYSYVWRP
jgi:TolB protein